MSISIQSYDILDGQQNYGIFMYDMAIWSKIYQPSQNNDCCRQFVRMYQNYRGLRYGDSKLGNMDIVLVYKSQYYYDWGFTG